MIANYHTHTWRCRHAMGKEKEYVEKAIQSGLKILGFSDHTPQVYPGAYVCPVKMEPRELEGYVDCVLALKKEYADDIEIRLGLEAEYLSLDKPRINEVNAELLTMIEQIYLDAIANT